MRKVTSIFLLGILLFNGFGYRVLIGYWQQRTKSELESRLDVNDYDESQLLSIKAPVTHLAYYNNSTAFERVNGSVELNGVEYKYVKRRLYNDTLEYLCLPDPGAMKLRASANKAFYIPFRSHNIDPYVITTGILPRAPFLLISSVFGDIFLFIPSITSGSDGQPPDGLG